MTRPEWAPEDIDLDRPNPARVYDYMLGGAHNFAADREAAHLTLAVMPDAALQAQANRAFLHRAVEFLTAAGVRQFLDIGSGIPTVGNVHEVAARLTPDARVAYVDIEPVAVAHSRSILAGNDRTAVVQEDARRPEAILDHPDVRGLIDFTRPVAVLMVALLHYIADEDQPHRIVARFRDALCPGSYLVIAHLTDEGRPEQLARLVGLAKRFGSPIAPRTRAQVARLFEGFELVEPGVVWGPLWHPEQPENVEQPELSNNFVGVGRKL